MEMETIDADVLRGAGEIAEFLFGDAEKRARVYNLIKIRRLPVFRTGHIVNARRSRLVTWSEEQEAASDNGDAA
jgi:hypothetical protein